VDDAYTRWLTEEEWQRLRAEFYRVPDVIQLGRLIESPTPAPAAASDRTAE